MCSSIYIIYVVVTASEITSNWWNMGWKKIITSSFHVWIVTEFWSALCVLFKMSIDHKNYQYSIILTQTTMTKTTKNINDEITFLSKIKNNDSKQWKFRLDQNEGKTQQVCPKTLHNSKFDLEKIELLGKLLIKRN